MVSRRLERRKQPLLVAGSPEPGQLVLRGLARVLVGVGPREVVGVAVEVGVTVPQAVLVGAPHPDGGLRYVGHVSTGFSVAGRRDLLSQLVQLEQPGHPFDSPAPPKPSVD